MADGKMMTGGSHLESRDEDVLPVNTRPPARRPTAWYPPGPPRSENNISNTATSRISRPDAYDLLKQYGLSKWGGRSPGCMCMERRPPRTRRWTRHGAERGIAASRPTTGRADRVLTRSGGPTIPGSARSRPTICCSRRGQRRGGQRRAPHRRSARRNNHLMKTTCCSRQVRQGVAEALSLADSCRYAEAAAREAIGSARRQPRAVNDALRRPDQPGVTDIARFRRTTRGRLRGDRGRDRAFIATSKGRAIPSRRAGADNRAHRPHAGVRPGARSIEICAGARRAAAHWPTRPDKAMLRTDGHCSRTSPSSQGYYLQLCLQRAQAIQLCPPKSTSDTRRVDNRLGELIAGASDRDAGRALDPGASRAGLDAADNQARRCSPSRGGGGRPAATAATSARRDRSDAIPK